MKSILNPPLDPANFATTKYNWEDLKDIITNKKFPILRHVDQETTYRLYSQKLKQEWKSIYDFVLHCKFNFDKRLVPLDIDDDCKTDEKKCAADVEVENNDYDDTSTIFDIEKNEEVLVKDGEIPTTLPLISSPPKGYVWEAFESPSGAKGSRRILAMNDFPYYMEDGIEHWCLWKLGGEDVTENDISWAKEELASRGDIIEMMHWINPVYLKSLPDIDHVHIVCLIGTHNI